MGTIFEYIKINTFFDTVDSIKGINEAYRDKDGSYVISTERWDCICTTYEEFYDLVCYIKKWFNNENGVFSYYDLRTGEVFDI